MPPIGPRCISRLGLQSLTCARMTGRYDLLSRDDLIRLLERCDPFQRYGLVWESAPNQDYLVFGLDAPTTELGRNRKERYLRLETCCRISAC
jgi:hypothetical protein